MASKRIAAREWKRKRKQQKQIMRLAAVGVCLLVILGIGYIVWDMWSRTYVMTFEGNRIPTSDLRFFSLFTEGTTFMDPLEQSLENLTHFLLIDQAARRNNIALTAEESAELNESVSELRGLFEMMEMSMPVSESRMAELMSQEILLERLMDIYTGDFTLDEASFSDTLEEFLERSRENFIQMEFRYHFATSMLASRTAWDDFFAIAEDGTEGFDEIILRDMHRDMLDMGMSPEELEDLTVPFISMETLRHGTDINPAILDYLTNLEVGDFSEPIQVGEEEFIIFIVDHKEIPSDEEISAVFRENYIMEQRGLIFSDLMNEWREAADIRVNQRGVNAA